jgi:hypothetical protein|tara:strand:- start:4110 stop:4307 length:198 start_codon:yes stop_codon:yes gene_type:complete
MVRHSTYQLNKITNKVNKIILETEAASLDRALDYFYLTIPESYSNKDYTISIKQGNYHTLAYDWR